VSRDGAPLEAKVQFVKPFVAAVDRTVTAMIQLPWMRYREPQALALGNSELSIRFISRPSIIGEAQGIWNVARLTLLDGDRTIRQIQDARDQRAMALERGLLVHVPVAYLDSTRVMPPLALRAKSAAGAAYL